MYLKRLGCFRTSFKTGDDGVLKTEGFFIGAVDMTHKIIPSDYRGDYSKFVSVLKQIKDHILTFSATLLNL